MAFFDDGEHYCSYGSESLLHRVAHTVSKRGVAPFAGVEVCISLRHLSRLGVQRFVGPCLSLANSFSIALVQAIIFLAPLTSNLALEEDLAANRLQDSLTIWKTICSSRLLKRTTVNPPMDVLTTTFESGLRASDYVTSYNIELKDLSSVVNCMSSLPCTNPIRRPFLQQTSSSTSRRVMYVFVPYRDFFHSKCTENGFV